MTGHTPYPRDQISGDLERLMLCLVLTEYAPDEMLYVLSFKGVAFAERTKAELSEVIRYRLWSRAFYERLTEMEFEHDDDLYRHLQTVWTYCYDAGPEPQPA
jgi:hypothetical protein